MTRSAMQQIMTCFVLREAYYCYIYLQLKDCASSATNNVCVLQFVLFPPHRCVQLREGVQDESVESDAVRDSKGELQIATEIWIEPQWGVASENEKDLKYVEGMKYYEIPAKVSF